MFMKVKYFCSLIFKSCQSWFIRQFDMAVFYYYVKKILWARPGFEPGTSRTLSETNEPHGMLIIDFSL